jgi:hypothetical protein
MNQPVQYPAGVKSRIWGSDTSFSNALRLHPRFQNRINVDTGICATDCDLIIYNYMHRGLKDVRCFQVIEVKSNNAEPDYAQLQAYLAFNAFKGKKDGIIHYGVSFISYNGNTLELSTAFRWGRISDEKRIGWRFVDRETMFDLAIMLKHPDTLTDRRMFRSHHCKFKVSMMVKTSLGFEVPAGIIHRS